MAYVFKHGGVDLMGFNCKVERLKDELRNHEGLIYPEKMLELIKSIRDVAGSTGVIGVIPNDQDKLEGLFLKIEEMVQDINRNALEIIVGSLGDLDKGF